MNWKHVVSFSLTALIWIVWGLGKAGVYDPAILAGVWPIAVMMLAPVWNWLGASSPQLPMFAKKVAPKIATGVSIVLLCAGLGLTQTGCPGAVPIVGPTTDCVATVIADALKGLSIDDIVKDAGTQCVKDASEVIAILLGAGQSNPMVRTTAAYQEAFRRSAPTGAVAPTGASK